MSEQKTIDVRSDGRVVRVTLSRPDVRNAFDEVMIRELTVALEKIERDRTARVLVLTGAGKSFCAGADLHWMKKMKGYGFEENLEDALALSRLLRRLYTLSLPTIAMVNGATIGGGNGLVAACDIAIASHRAEFSLAEVKIGLVPACIGPYVIERIGVRAARELFLTGERISADRARDEGLVNHVVAHDLLAERVEMVVGQLVSSGPMALRVSKELVREVPRMGLDEAGRYTAEMIARLRITEEAQEGMAAFLEKRKPTWSQ